jgi:hypothetical protein
VIGLRRRIGQRRPHIILAQIGAIRRDLRSGRTAGEYLQNSSDTNASPGEDRTPAADGRVDGNAGKPVNVMRKGWGRLGRRSRRRIA